MCVFIKLFERSVVLYFISRILVRGAEECIMESSPGLDSI